MTSPAVSAVPLATDIFSRAMVDMFDETDIIGAPTGFQAFFGRPETGAKTLFSPDASVVEIDIMRGNEKIAALVPRGTVSRPLNSPQLNTQVEKFSSFSRRYPLAEEEGAVSASQLEFRVAGENPYEARPRLQRMRSLAVLQTKEHIRRLVRLFEVLAASSVISGKMPVDFADLNKVFSWNRKSTHTFAPTTPWSTSTAPAMADLDTACRLIREDGHVNPDMAVFAADVMDAFLANEDVIAKADNRRFELIMINRDLPVPPRFARFVEGGFIPRGRLRTPEGYELWLFTYPEVYTDKAGDASRYMEDGKAVIASSMARCDRYFGPPEILPNIPMRDQLYSQLFGFSMDAPPMPPMIKDMANAVNPAMFYHDAYPSDDWKRVTIRTQAAPIFATTMTDAFVTLEDLIAT